MARSRNGLANGFTEPRKRAIDGRGIAVVDVSSVVRVR
jgi:hypothetical protein